MHNEQRRLVLRMNRVHGANHGYVVDLLDEMRNQLGDPGTGLSVLLEFERAPHQAAGSLRRRYVVCDLFEVWLAVMLVEHRLGVEEVHLARCAVHEELDDTFRLGREMRRARLQIVYATWLFFIHRRCAIQVFTEQGNQRSALQAVYSALEEGPARDLFCYRLRFLVLHVRCSPQSIYRNAAEFIKV